MVELTRRIDTSMQWADPRTGRMTSQAFDLMDAWRAHLTGTVQPIPCTLEVDDEGPEEIADHVWLTATPISVQTNITDYAEGMALVVPIGEFISTDYTFGIRLPEQEYLWVMNVTLGYALVPLDSVLSDYGSSWDSRWQCMLTYSSEFPEFSPISSGWAWRLHV